MNGRTGLALSWPGSVPMTPWSSRIDADSPGTPAPRRRCAQGHRLADSAVFLLGDQNLRSSADSPTVPQELCCPVSLHLQRRCGAFGTALCLQRASPMTAAQPAMTGVTTDL